MCMCLTLYTYLSTPNLPPPTIHIHTIDEVKQGKQAHIASAAEKIATDYHIKVTRASTLFIDDDYTNIQIALGYSIRSIWFDAESVDPDNYIENELLREFC